MAAAIVCSVSATSYGISRYIISEDIAKGLPLAAERRAQIEKEQKNQERAQKLHDGLALIEKKLAERPTDSLLLITAANFAYQAEAFEKAQKYYKQYLEFVDPKNVGVQIDYAAVLTGGGKTDEAITILKGIIDADSKNQMALFNLGLVYVQLQDVENAKLWMKKCRAVSDTSAIGSRALSVLQALDEIQ